MTFKKNNEYFLNSIKNIENAIIGTQKTLRELTNKEGDYNREIEAHASYLWSLEKSLNKKKNEFETFKKLPENCADCQFRAGRCHANTKIGSKKCLENICKAN